MRGTARKKNLKREEKTRKGVTSVYGNYAGGGKRGARALDDKSSHKRRRRPEFSQKGPLTAERRGEGCEV